MRYRCLTLAVFLLTPLASSAQSTCGFSFAGTYLDGATSTAVPGSDLSGTWAPSAGRGPYYGTIRPDNACVADITLPDDATYVGTMVNNCQISWSYANSTITNPNNSWYKESCSSTYSIAATAGANGSISPLGATDVAQGSDQAYTVTPDAGYRVADVLVDGSSVGAVNSYTFTNVQATHTIEASFAISVIATDLIVNGSFEQGSYFPVIVGAWVDVKTGDTKLTGWTVEGWLNWHNSAQMRPVYDGNLVVDLNNGGTGTGTGTISQTFSTVAGQTYTLTFELAGPGIDAPGTNPAFFANPRQVTVEVAGQQYTFSTPASASNLALVWAEQTLNFVASAQQTTLTFSSPNEAGFWGPVLDDVRVTWAQVADTTPPEIAPPADVSAEATGPQTAVAIGTATATDDVTPSPTITSNAPSTFPVGTTVVTWMAVDEAGNTATADPHVTVVDTTPPHLVLSGANPLLLELGTTYPEPGATASDLVDGDLTNQLQTTGSVNSGSEGTYTVTYSVADAAGNPATVQRTVKVVVTANSYGVLALHSMQVRQKVTIHSGFVGVLNFGDAPYEADGVELVVGQNVTTEPGVRVSSPRVWIRQKADVLGTLVYTEADLGRNVTIGEQVQVPAEAWPLLGEFGAPAFPSVTPGTEGVALKQRESRTLTPGAYGEVSAKQKSTLIFTGGEYDLLDLDIGQQVTVLFQAPTTLRIARRLGVDQKSYFGPADGSLGAADIVVYVAGINGNTGNLHATPEAAKVGELVQFNANLYVPNGEIHLRAKSVCTGSFIGRDIIVGELVEVYGSTGWHTPEVFYQAPAAPAARPVAALADAGPATDLVAADGVLAYPNPFNPSTTLRYQLAEAGDVQLTVYNIAGQRVRVLVDGVQTQGVYSIVWDGRDEAGGAVGTGMYIYSCALADRSTTARWC